MPTKTIKEDEQKFDLRVIEQRLRTGEIDQKEYEEFLKKLPDDAKNVDYVEVFEEPTTEDSTDHIDEPTFISA